MWKYEKRLQYPVKISQPNPKMAQFIISQYGGPDGEMGASMRYLSQRYSMPYKMAKGTLTDIGISAAIWPPVKHPFIPPGALSFLGIIRNPAAFTYPAEYPADILSHAKGDSAADVPAALSPFCLLFSGISDFLIFP